MNKEEAYADVADRLEKDYPKTVILSEENPKLVGEFIRVDSGPSEYGPVPIVVLRDKDGEELGLWLFHAVLKNQFAQKSPKVGAIVGVRYLGESMGGSGRKYHNYRVEVWSDAEAQDFDWSILTDEDASADLAGDIQLDKTQSFGVGVTQHVDKPPVAREEQHSGF